MLTEAQAAQYLDEAHGVTVPGFVVAAGVEKAVSREAELIAAGYTASAITLMQCMLVALLVLSQSPRSIRSQGAPSGASRSFAAEDADKVAAQIRRALVGMDTAGVLTDLLPPSTRPAFVLAV